MTTSASNIFVPVSNNTFGFRFDLPKVSLIVSLRNEEHNISNLVNCIKNQSYAENKLEVICINDHSTDNTLKLLLSEKNKWNKLNVVNLEENGSRSPIPYVLPPGIQRETYYTATTNQEQNEQAMVLKIIDLVIGLRVDEESERDGLDKSLHGETVQ